MVEAPRGRASGSGASRARDRGTVLLACDFAAYQPGNFLRTEFLVGHAIRSRLGLDCSFLLPERAARRSWVREIDAEGFSYEFLPRSPARRVATLLRYGRETGACLIHSHFTRFDLECLYVGRRLGAPVVWHLHNGLLDYPIRQRITDIVKVRALGRLCDTVVACSDSVGRDALRRGFPLSKIEVVRNALVPDRFDEASSDRSTVRAGLGIDDDAFLILSFCWPPERKGTDVLVRAVHQLEDCAASPFCALVVGPPPLASYIVEHFGRMPRSMHTIPPVDDVVSLFGAADVFVSAAREEGFSYAIGEAMAASLPVIASDIPGTSHFLDAPGFCTYPVGDAEALRQRLAQSMTRSELQAHGALNRDWARANLDIVPHVEATVSLYQRLLHV